MELLVEALEVRLIPLAHQVHLARPRRCGSASASMQVGELRQSIRRLRWRELLERRERMTVRLEVRRARCVR